MSVSDMLSDSDKRILSRLQNLCVRKEYCEKDMYRKALDALDGNQEKAAQMLDLLVKDRFVDNLRYACAFARDKSSLQGWGPLKIRFALKTKGIPDSTIMEAIAEIDSEKSSRKLEQLLATKWKSLKDDPAGRLKLIKFALGRGYEYDEVSSLTDRITKG